MLTDTDILTETEFNYLFNVVKNSANGNCLFESIEHILIYSDYEFAHGITKSSRIRKMVCDFYKNFDRDIDYPESTIEYRIKMGILFDNIDEDGLEHDSNISNDKVWASMTDLLICSLLFKMNIQLYVSQTKVTLEDNDEIISVTTYELSNIKTQYNFKTTARLLYSDANHFEALDRKM